MKLKLDLQNQEDMKFLIGFMGYFILLIHVMQLASERQAPGFIALGAVFISIIVLKFSTSRRLKVIALCVWVPGLAFLGGYLLTIVILE